MGWLLRRLCVPALRDPAVGWAVEHSTPYSNRASSEAQSSEERNIKRALGERTEKNTSRTLYSNEHLCNRGGTQTLHV